LRIEERRITSGAPLLGPYARTLASFLITSLLSVGIVVLFRPAELTLLFIYVAVFTGVSFISDTMRLLASRKTEREPRGESPIRS
jgi:hypothetical protein